MPYCRVCGGYQTALLNGQRCQSCVERITKGEIDSASPLKIARAVRSHKNYKMLYYPARFLEDGEEAELTGQMINPNMTLFQFLTRRAVPRPTEGTGDQNMPDRRGMTLIRSKIALSLTILAWVLGIFLNLTSILPFFLQIYALSMVIRARRTEPHSWISLVALLVILAYWALFLILIIITISDPNFINTITDYVNSDAPTG
jgi:hypothetical protein